MLGKLESERRAVTVRIAGEERWIAAEDAGLYRDALGVPPPGGLPDAFLEPVADAMAVLVRRYARTHGPFPTGAARDAATASTRSPALRELERGGELVRGELLPGGTEREWCDPEVLRRLRRVSLAAPARARSRPPTSASWPASSPAGRTSTPTARRRRPRPPARGAGPAPGRRAHARRSGSATCCRAASAPTARRGSTSCCTGGEIVWIGAGALGRSDGRVALYFREDVHLAGPPPANAKLDAPEGEVHDAIREYLGARPRSGSTSSPTSTSRPRSCTTRSGTSPGPGEATNDAFAPLRAPRLSRGAAKPARQPPLLEPPRRRGPGRPGPLVADRAALRARARRRAAAARPVGADARALRDRHARDRARRGRARAASPRLYGELSNLEMLGTARRGYFVEGLGGAQFALPGRGRAAALAAARGGQVPRARRDRPRQPLRRARSRGPSARARAGAGRAARRAPTCCFATASRCCSSSAAAAACCASSASRAPSSARPCAVLAEAAGDGLVAAARDRARRRRAGDRLRTSRQTLIEAGFSRQPRRLVASA